MATPFVPYHPGTVQVTNGGKAIVGTGTNFLAYDPYDVLIVDGYWVLLDTITDATHATAKFNYLGGGGSGKAYEWVPQSDVTKALTLFQSLSAAFTSGNVQAFAALASAADKLGYFTGAGTMAVTALTAKARSLIGQADEAAMRTFLGVAPKQANTADTTVGAGLIAGAFGIGATGTGFVTNDLNTALAGGLYYFNSGAANAPFAQGVVLTIPRIGTSATGEVYQLAIGTGGLMVCRARVSGAWESWSPIGGGKGTISSGSWWRVGGMQVCTQTVRLSDVITSTILGSTWNYPMAFASPPNVLHSPRQGSSADTGPGLGDRFHPETSGTGTSSVSLRTIAAAGSFVSGNFIDVDAIAIGPY